MPYGGEPPELDWKRWYACQKQVKLTMVRAGWRTDAKKFSEVSRRKTFTLYNSGARV